MAFESQAHFEDLLLHGYFDHHPDSSGFSVAQLSRAQYAELVSLAESYFLAGYSWFMPMALRELDRQLLQSRFGKRA